MDRKFCTLSSIENEIDVERQRLEEAKQVLQDLQAKREERERLYSLYDAEDHFLLRKLLIQWQKATQTNDIETIIEKVKKDIEEYQMVRSEYREFVEKRNSERGDIANLAQMARKFIKNIELNTFRNFVVNALLVLPRFDTHRDYGEFGSEEIKIHQQQIQILSQILSNLKSHKPLIQVPQACIQIEPSSQMIGCLSVGHKMFRESLGLVHLSKAPEFDTNCLDTIESRISKCSEVIQSIHLPKRKRPENHLKLNKLLLDKREKYQTLKRDAAILHERKEELELLPEEIRTASPEKLLEWYKRLLEQSKTIREKYEVDLKRAQLSLENTKLIKNSRIAALRKKLDD